MRILALTSTFPRWPGDTVPPFVFLLTKAIVHEGTEVIVLAPHYKGAKFFEVMDGIKVHRFPYFFPASLQRLCYDGGIMANFKNSLLAKLQVPFLFIMEFLFCLYCSLKYSPQALHAHWIVPQGIVAGAAGRLLRIPVVTTVHGSDVSIFQKGQVRKLIRWVARVSTAMTVNSTFSLRLLKNILKGPQQETSLTVIPMGVDTAVFSPAKKVESPIVLRPGKPMLLAVGRLVEQKGFNFILEAMPPVLERYPDAKLLIIGDGPARAVLTKRTRELSLEKHISFLGNLPNTQLSGYFASADIFIGPSIEASDGATEAFGVVFLEALASGVPVIATNIGGISDIIKHEVTGIQVPEKDPDSICRAIDKILKDKELRRTLSQNGLKAVNEKFSWGGIADRFISLYNASYGPPKK